MSLMKLQKVLFAVIATAVAIAGCGSAKESNALFNDADAMFAQMMIPHHEQAIEMSEMALMNSTNPDVLELAQKIKSAQDPEIDLMKSWAGVKVSTHAGHMMDGMLSDQQIQQLRDTEGVTFDRLFLEGMIAHHQGAIKMADTVIAEGKSAPVQELANAIIQAQKSEIDTLELLLK